MRRFVPALAFVTFAICAAACGDNAPADACLAMQCPLPDPPTCTDGATLVVTQFSTCDDTNGCQYSKSTINCAETGQVCAAGACHAPGDPCVGETCTTPPAPTCTLDTLTTYDATGTCDGSSGNAVCTYASHDTDCTATNQVCRDGGCVDRCAGMVCDQPPAASCAANGDLTTYAASGTCNSTTGLCEYTPAVSHCAGMNQQCDANAGACVDPCATNPCTSPPADFCDDPTHAHEHLSLGTCTSPGGVVSCAYDKPVDCGATDQACVAGACVDPCATNPCTSPPADFCDDATHAHEHLDPGTCTSPDGVVSCAYDKPVDCGAIDQTCDAATGQCLDPCVGFACDTPPAAFCDADGKTLESYAATGTCSSPGGTPGCDYGTPAPTDCSASNGVCLNGACLDACAPNPCTSPPVDVCVDGTHANIHLNPGACVGTSGSPVCSYDHVVDCGAQDKACSGGACIDPCAGFVCTTPPPAACVGTNNNTAETFAAVGTCSSPGGAPTCSYTKTDRDCSLTGQTCDTGACTGPSLFVRLQFPGTITDIAGATETVYGRIYIQGVTDVSGVDDPVGANVKVQLGVGTGSDPSAWTWTDAVQNGAYGPGSPGYEANNDEYQGTFTVAGAPGTTASYAYRLSNDGGTTWLYGDLGAAGSSDGFTTPGVLTVAAPFFSEYIEGAVNTNKAVEIYNPGSIAFSLTGCQLQVFHDGGTTPINSNFTAGGSVPAGGVYVLCKTGIADTSHCSQQTGSGLWNGNDAIALVCGATTYDVIGQIGTDPGAAGWGSAGTTTTDHTLLRQCNVISGDPDGSDAFDPAAQWAGLPGGHPAVPGRAELSAPMTTRGGPLPRPAGNAVRVHGAARSRNWRGTRT
jgi:hypothetical protein